MPVISGIGHSEPLLHAARTPQDSQRWNLLHNHFDEFTYNRKLLSELCRLAQKSLLLFFRTTLDKPESVLATVMAIQTFGDYAKWHPHIHSPTADGLFDERGVFYCMSKSADIQPLAELFRAVNDHPT